MTNPDSHKEPTDAPLLPCPFCGKPPRTCPDDSYGAARVWCPDDNECWGQPEAWAILANGENLAVAIERWNTRSMEAKPDPEGAEADAEWLRKVAAQSDVHGDVWFDCEEKRRLERIADRLTAKPSLEPMELVEALDEVLSALSPLTVAGKGVCELDTRLARAVTSAVQVLARERSSNG